MGIGETITVINKSGKVVKSSKHIFGVFNEAKAAYRERKAEIKAERDASAAASERKLRESVRSVRLEDDVRSRASSRHSRHSKATHGSKSHRPPLDSAEDNGAASPRSRSRRHRFEQDLAGGFQQGQHRELVRRHTEAFVQAPSGRASRPRSESHIDMDLAYGELPPPLPSKKYDDGELREKASKLTMLLDEANCLQHSVTTMIENLQKNPDALAAVALTLAEISSILGKMGPGVLLSFKGAFPAIVALLASPQFMIAAGVGVGVTIVALGGFKIIKKMQAKKEEDRERMIEEPLQLAHPSSQVQEEPREESFNGLDELEPPELGRIEMWRRGIADVEADSMGSTVDGEFITPGATRHLVAEGVLDEDDIKSRRSTKSRKDNEKDKEGKSHRSAKSVHSSSTKKTSKTSKTSKSAKSSSTSRSTTMKEKKEKEPSLMKTLFRSHTMAH